MVEQFLNHIQRHSLCKTSDKILLAVSGGIDSMTMLHLFKKAGFNIGVAHCNYQLRGLDSDGDELLIKTSCEADSIPFFVSRFDTAGISEARKQSIQMVARELRYQFFQDILRQHHYDYIATAHHSNDSLETVLLNLVRGTGLDGLTGIPIRNGKIIRPLLFASRKMIHAYAIQSGIQWREDVSNNKNEYQRNLIRNRIIPELSTLNPNLETTFLDTVERINAMHEFAQAALLKLRAEIITEKGDQLYIDIEALKKKYKSPEALIWEVVKDRGFNYDQCRMLVLEHQSGKVFFSTDFMITVDRGRLILEKRKNVEGDLSIVIQEDDKNVIGHGSSLYLEKRSANDFKLNGNEAMAQLDLEKIAFPLGWRKWKEGDVFTPLGMKSRKKISDLLIDLKIPLPDKKNITVLESGGEIIWVVGVRVSDGYKVTQATKQLLVLNCLSLKV